MAKLMSVTAALKQEDICLSIRSVDRQKTNDVSQPRFTERKPSGEDRVTSGNYSVRMPEKNIFWGTIP